MFDAQIHLPDEVANQIQANLQANGETFEQFVQQAVVHELRRQNAKDLKAFLKSLQPLESFFDIDAEAYVDNLRGRVKR